MPTPRNDDILSIDGWPGGVNTRIRETENDALDLRVKIPAGIFLREAENVDLTRMGRVMRRAGFSRRATGFAHSLWSDPGVRSAFVVLDGVLTALEGPEMVQTPIREVTPYRPMSYAAVNGEVYWSNGMETGRVTSANQDRIWGMDVPGSPGLTVSMDGGLFAGLYHVTCTFSDVDGIEHGAATPVSIRVDEFHGIRVDAPTPPEGAAMWNVYCTQANGEVYYLARSVPAFLTQVVLTAEDMGIGRLLETLDRHPPRTGHIVRYGNGRIFIARRDTVTFTDPLRYHLMQPSQGLYMFDSDVLLMEPTQGGVYVGVEGRIFFVAGSDPYDVQQRVVHPYGPVAGAVTHVPGHRLEAAVDRVPVFWTQDGQMWAGLPDGLLRPLTGDRFWLPPHRQGAMLYRKYEGMEHVVSVLAQGGEASRMMATDSIVAEVRRNCVKLNRG
jgi:hypothetical protein